MQNRETGSHPQQGGRPATRSDSTGESEHPGAVTRQQGGVQRGGCASPHGTLRYNTPAEDLTAELSAGNSRSEAALRGSHR